MISVKYFIAMQTNLLVYHSDNKNITNQSSIKCSSVAVP